MIRKANLILGIGVSLWALGCGGAAAGGESSATGEPTARKAAKSPLVVQAKGWLDAAAMALAEGDRETALENYAEAARLYDESDEVIVDRAEAHYLAGDLAYRLGRIDQAITHNEAAAVLYLRFEGQTRIKAAVVLTNVGVIYKEQHNLPKAVSSWEQALQVYKEAPPELRNLTHMAKIEQNISDAREGF